MRVPMMSAGTRSGVNCRRANVPPTAVASVSTARVFATPGTPSSSTCPRASSATSMRSTSRSWPTITRLISKSTRSSLAASTDGGTGAPRAAVFSSGVLAALVTGLPDRAGPRPREDVGRGRQARPPASVLHLREGTTRAARPPADRAHRRSQVCPPRGGTASLNSASGSSPRGCPTPELGLRARAHGPRVAPPPHVRHLDDVAGPRRLHDLPVAHVEGHVVDRVRVVRVGRPEDEVPGLQIAGGDLGQRRVQRPAVARDPDPGLAVGVLGQAAAVEADRVAPLGPAAARAGGAATTPGVGRTEVAQGGSDGGLRGGRRTGTRGGLIALGDRGRRRRGGRLGGRGGRPRGAGSGRTVAEQLAPLRLRRAGPLVEFGPSAAPRPPPLAGAA